jgi:hypothetical protein
MTHIKLNQIFFFFWGGVPFIPWVPNFEIKKPYFLVEYFFPWIRRNFFLGQKIKILPR